MAKQDTYIVVASGLNKDGEPYSVGQKVISLSKTKNSNHPVEFLSSKDRYYLDEIKSLGTMFLVDMSVSAVDM